MSGDGYRTALHCPNAPEEEWPLEPDSEPVFCPVVHVSVWKTREPKDEVSSGSHN
jgi:hypothetical protein